MSKITLKRIHLLVFVFSIAAITSCKKDDDTEETTSTTTTEMSLTEASAIVRSSLYETNGGFLMHLSYADGFIEDELSSMNCGSSKTAHVLATGPNGGDDDFSSDFNYENTLACDTSFSPSRFTFNYSGSLTYESLEISSSSEPEGSLLVFGLSDSNSTNLVSLNETRTSTVQSAYHPNRTYTNTLSLILSGVQVDFSATKPIVSGFGTLTISGESNLGDSYEYYGTVEFNSDYTASVTWSSGESSTFDLYAD